MLEQQFDMGLLCLPLTQSILDMSPRSYMDLFKSKLSMIKLTVVKYVGFFFIV